MRINRFLAELGLASRRKAETIVREGRVSVNGTKIVDLSTTVNPDVDEIYVDGKLVGMGKKEKVSRVLALYKPAGYLTSHKDEFHTKTIFDLLPKEFSLYKFAGRLDLPSRGLLFLSDSGDIIQNLSHPSSGTEKEYRVKLSRSMSATEVASEFLMGIRDQGETLRAKRIQPDRGESKVFDIVLEEGRKRQIRRMFSKIGGKVEDLLRIRIGNCKLENLNIKEGEWCWVSLDQI